MVLNVQQTLELDSRRHTHLLTHAHKCKQDIAVKRFNDCFQQHEIYICTILTILVDVFTGYEGHTG